MSLILESSFSLVRRTETGESLLSDVPLFVDYVNRTVSGSLSGTGNTVTSQIQFAVKARWSVADHNLAWGVQYVESSISQTSISGVFDIDRYKSQYEVDSGTGGGTSEVAQRDPSAFVQDSWQVSPALCVNVG